MTTLYAQRNGEATPPAVAQLQPFSYWFFEGDATWHETASETRGIVTLVRNPLCVTEQVRGIVMLMQLPDPATGAHYWAVCPWGEDGLAFHLDQTHGFWWGPIPMPAWKLT